MLKPEDKMVRVEELTSLMVGKTISAIDETACNCLNIEFTDGTELLLETEHMGHNIHGVVGYVRKNDVSITTLNNSTMPDNEEVFTFDDDYYKDREQWTK